MLAVHIPNPLPNSVLGKNMSWTHPAGRLIWAVVILLIGVGVIVFLARRPKPAEPPTWAQAMLGALAAFALMILAYGTIPHEWIIFANSYLRWGTAKYVFQKNRFIHFDVNKQTANDGDRRAHLRRDARSEHPALPDLAEAPGRGTGAGRRRDRGRAAAGRDVGVRATRDGEGVTRDAA